MVVFRSAGFRRGEELSRSSFIKSRARRFLSLQRFTVFFSLPSLVLPPLPGEMKRLAAARALFLDSIFSLSREGTRNLNHADWSRVIRVIRIALRVLTDRCTSYSSLSLSLWHRAVSTIKFSAPALTSYVFKSCHVSTWEFKSLISNLF